MRGAGFLGTGSCCIAWNKPCAKRFQDFRLGGGKRFEGLAVSCFRRCDLRLSDTASCQCGGGARPLEQLAPGVTIRRLIDGALTHTRLSCLPCPEYPNRL